MSLGLAGFCFVDKEQVEAYRELSLRQRSRQAVEYKPHIQGTGGASMMTYLGEGILPISPTFLSTSGYP